jgi:phage FluMu protein Com
MEKCYLCGADAESPLYGRPKCPKCGEPNETVSQKASESEKPTTKLLGSTAVIVGK